MLERRESEVSFLVKTRWGAPLTLSHRRLNLVTKDDNWVEFIFQILFLRSIFFFLWASKTNDTGFGHRELKKVYRKNSSGEGEMSNQIDPSVFIPQHQYMQYYSPQIPQHMMQTQYHEVSLWGTRKMSDGKGYSRDIESSPTIFYIILMIYNPANTAWYFLFLCHVGESIIITSFLFILFWLIERLMGMLGREIGSHTHVPFSVCVTRS